MITHLADYYEKGNSKKFYWNWDGKSSELGMPIRTSRTRFVLIGKRGYDIKMAGRKQNFNPI